MYLNCKPTFAHPCIIGMYKSYVRSFIHSLRKHLLGTYNTSGTMLGTGQTNMGKLDNLTDSVARTLFSIIPFRITNISFRFFIYAMVKIVLIS